MGRFGLFTFVALLGSGVVHASPLKLQDFWGEYTLVQGSENCPVSLIVRREKGQPQNGISFFGYAPHSSGATSSQYTLAQVSGVEPDGSYFKSEAKLRGHVLRSQEHRESGCLIHVDLLCDTTEVVEERWRLEFPALSYEGKTSKKSLSDVSQQSHTTCHFLETLHSPAQ